jgi:type I restriction enzyme S subunit
MKSNYKKLGPYISPKSFLNEGMEVKELLGISNQKYFQKSHTNTIGIDLSTYRIVRTNQFAFNRATTRNGEKISIALRQGDDCIVSPSYRIFQVNDENELLSEYLLMWFKRPEFDRYVRFKSHGSAHEFFEFDQMCEVELPIPSITKQREIVKEYNVIQNRLALNQQLIQKLEETAQAIYKQWFVDFEFPAQDGKPYKSNGGEMVWNEELQKEIPLGWVDKFLTDFVLLSQGIQVDVEDQLLEKSLGMNRFLRIIDYTPNTEEAPRFVNLNDERYYCSSDEIAMIRYGDAGTVCRRFEGIIANNLFKISPINGLTNNFLYYFLNDSENQKKIRNSDLAVAMPAITHNTIKQLPIVYPQSAEKLIIDFDNYTQIIENNILLKIKEIENLKTLTNLLLSKLATIEK